MKNQRLTNHEVGVILHSDELHVKSLTSDVGNNHHRYSLYHRREFQRLNDSTFILADCGFEQTIGITPKKLSTKKFNRRSRLHNLKRLTCKLKF
jgi:hypothetical protein